MSKNTIGTGHPKVTCNVSGLSKPKIDWVTEQVANTWSDAAREAAAEARREQSAGASGEDAANHAERLSAVAAEKSRAANAAPSQQAHEDAAHAHDDASDAHDVAASKFKAEGNRTQQLYHEDRVNAHDSKVVEHADKAEAAGSGKSGAKGRSIPRASNASWENRPLNFQGTRADWDKLVFKHGVDKANAVAQFGGRRRG